LSDLAKSIAITPSGQSGHLASRHYDDLVNPWLAGEYHPMLWARSQVEAETEAKLVIRSVGN
jgi:penicillin amidase